MRRLVIALTFAAWLAAVPAAAADERIEAAPFNRYSTPEVTMDQGERLTFLNLDFTRHDVSAESLGPDGRPLFSTPLIEQDEEAFVEGSQYLVTGDYAFICTVHSNMRGVLHVTSAGTPVPRPGGGTTPPPAAPADRRAPKVSLRFSRRALAAARQGRALALRVRIDEPATVALTVSARGVRIGRRTTTLATAGAHTIRLRVSPRARRALRRARSLTVTLSATDAAGNEHSDEGLVVRAR